MAATRVGVVAVATLAAASCTVHPVDEQPKPPASMPDRFTTTGRVKAWPDRWWRSFDDAHLNELVALALAGNLDLKQAWARVRQAEMLARQAASAKWPEFTFSTGASRSQSVFSAGEFGAFSGTSSGTGAGGAATGAGGGFGFSGDGEPISFEIDRVPLTLGASYEVDVWRRIASLADAARLDVEASQRDGETLAMSLAAQIADAWFGVLEERAQLTLLAEQAEVSQTFLDLTKLRFGQGQASALDVYQQRQQVAATRAQVPQIESRLAVSMHRLAVLTGKPPHKDVTGKRSALPGLPPLPATGLPLALLDRRPDVETARLRVVGADHRVAAAIADRFPALRLGTSTGFEATDFDELARIFDNWVWSLSANLTWPVFDGGRRQAEVERTKAVVLERLHAYRQAVLVALREVEDALVQEQKQAELVRHLEEQVELGQATLREARMRYVRGLNDYLPVLTALQSLQQLERSLLSARRQVLVFRVQLHRALGGHWMKTSGPVFSPG